MSLCVGGSLENRSLEWGGQGSTWPGPGPHGAACVVPDLSGLQDVRDLRVRQALEESLCDTWPQPAPRSSLKLITRCLNGSVSFFSLVAPLWLVRPHVGGTEAGGCQLWGPSQISPAWGQRSHVGTDPRAGISLSIASWGLAVPSHCPWGSPCHPSHHGMTTSSTSQGWCREQPRTALTVSPQQALPSWCPIMLGPSTALPSDTVGA